MESGLKILGSVVIQVRDRASAIKRAHRNSITLNGVHWQIERWLGSEASALTHVAVGDGTAPVEPGNLALSNERARKPLVSRIRDGEVLLAEAFFDRSDANFDWNEVGLFAGGTSTPGSGVLVARALITESKDELRTATVTWQWEVRNG